MISHSIMHQSFPNVYWKILRTCLRELRSELISIQCKLLLVSFFRTFSASKDNEIRPKPLKNVLNVSLSILNGKLEICVKK